MMLSVIKSMARGTFPLAKYQTVNGMPELLLQLATALKNWNFM